MVLRCFSKLTVENRQAVDFALMQLTKLNKARRTNPKHFAVDAAGISESNNTEAQAVHASVELCKAFGKARKESCQRCSARIWPAKKTRSWPEEQNDPMGFIRSGIVGKICRRAGFFPIGGRAGIKVHFEYRAPQPTTVRINPSKRREKR